MAGKGPGSGHVSESTSSPSAGLGTKCNINPSPQNSLCCRDVSHCTVLNKSCWKANSQSQCLSLNRKTDDTRDIGDGSKKKVCCTRHLDGEVTDSEHHTGTSIAKEFVSSQAKDVRKKEENLCTVDRKLILLHLCLGTSTRQCCGSASVIMRIRIQDPKNVHMDPDPRG